MARSRTTNPVRCRRAAVAVLVAVCATAVFAILAVVLDGGMLMEDQRRAQGAADAAASAAAADLYAHYATNGPYQGCTIFQARNHPAPMTIQSAGAPTASPAAFTPRRRPST